MAGENNNNGDHSCIRQEDFDDLQKATGKLALDLALNTQATIRLEQSVEKMVESVTKLSDAMLVMQSTQVTASTFNEKFEEMRERFRREKEECVKNSEDRDEALHRRVDKAVKVIDRHDLYFWIIGTILVLLLNNALDIFDRVKEFL